MKRLLLLTASMITCTSYAQDIKGTWSETSQIINSENVPEYVFTVSVLKADKNILGEYCYVYQYGKRINCDQTFTGLRVDNHYKITLNNDGVAELQPMQNNKLIWKTIKKPRDYNFLIPTTAILLNDKSTDGYLKINKTKSYIYSEPNYHSKTKSYLIKGDNVRQKEVKGDWIKIQYKDKIVGWLKKQDVN